MAACPAAARTLQAGSSTAARQYIPSAQPPPPPPSRPLRRLWPIHAAAAAAVTAAIADARGAKGGGGEDGLRQQRAGRHKCLWTWGLNWYARCRVTVSIVLLGYAAQ